MSKDRSHLTLHEINETARGQPYRHSLQPKSTTAEVPFRHTQSQNYGKTKKAKTKPPEPAIPELDTPDGDEEIKVKLDAINENVRVSVSESKSSKRHKLPRQPSQASSRSGFDNAAFEPDKGSAQVSRSNSVSTSIRSSGSRVIKEQYCCCMRWTPCERTLCATAGVLTFIIIILVVVIALMVEY